MPVPLANLPKYNLNITTQDLTVFIGFFAVVIGLSVWKSRRKPGHDANSSDFFLAGRGLTWPLIGISIVAANISTEQMVGMEGQAAGSTGLAVSCWQLLGSVFIVLISMTLLPRFLRAGIYTMPEHLEYRADLVQGLALLAGGMLIFSLGLNAIGGWDKFAEANAAKLHMIMPADNKDLPWTGVVAAFVMPFVLSKVPGAAGVAALLTDPLAYAAFQFTSKSETRPSGHENHFLLQVLLAFLIVAAVMTAITAIAPLAKAKELPVREEMNLQTEPIVKLAGAAVILGVVVFFIIFW